MSATPDPLASATKLDDEYFKAFEQAVADAVVTGGFGRLRGAVWSYAVEAHRRGENLGRQAAASPTTEGIEAAVKAAAGVLFERISALLEEDSHQFGNRPCGTCRAITGLIGRPFGCEAVAARKLAKEVARG